MVHLKGLGLPQLSRDSLDGTAQTHSQDTAMKFFIPTITDPQTLNETYEGIKKFVSQEMGDVITKRRIFSIDCLHNMKEYHAEVGKKDQDTGEIICAILESDRMYYVCTPDRGVLRGMPLLTGRNEIRLVTEFED